MAVRSPTPALASGQQAMLWARGGERDGGLLCPPGRQRFGTRAEAAPWVPSPIPRTLCPGPPGVLVTSTLRYPLAGGLLPALPLLLLGALSLSF